MNLVKSRIENTVCGSIGAFTEKEQQIAVRISRWICK